MKNIDTAPASLQSAVAALNVIAEKSGNEFIEFTAIDALAGVERHLEDETNQLAAMQSQIAAMKPQLVITPGCTVGWRVRVEDPSADNPSAEDVVSTLTSEITALRDRLKFLYRNARFQNGEFYFPLFSVGVGVNLDEAIDKAIAKAEAEGRSRAGSTERGCS